MAARGGGGLITLRYPTEGARRVVDAQARRLPNAYHVALEAVTDLYKQALVEATPKGKSGRLARGWRVRRAGRGGTALNTIYNVRGRQLGWILEGTAPHTIRAAHRIRSGPRKGQPGYLKFGGGTDVFAREVHHPGTRANPFHRSVARSARREASGIMRRTLVKTLKG